MSCALTKHCTFSNLNALKRILFPDEKTAEELLREDDNWDNRWNWDSSDAIPALASSNKHDESINWWLCHCLISISPFGDIIAFAKDVNLAIYKLKPELSDKHNEKDDNDDLFQSCGRTLTGIDANEKITCILCLPLASQQRSSGGTPDWTCVILGFSSGYIRIYTDTGGLLLAQILHDDTLISIKCQTCNSNDNHNQIEEILLVYPNIVVLIDGFALYQTLRSCRAQLAKTQSVASGGFGFGFVNPNDNSQKLVFKKWNLQSADRVSDCENVGVYSKNLYDHLVSQSIHGPYGPHGPNKSQSANTLVATGDNPYIGFYRANDSDSHTILNEISQAVMNKVKNMIPISLFGSNKQNDDPKTKIEPATDIPLRIGLFDQNRDGIKINLSPNRRLAAVCDDFGRVTLIDVHKMIALRMWKGYRDAEIGWAQVNEDEIESPSSKRALFLIIYAPKRGILEIWCCQMGPRVTAFSVGRWCRLIQCSYSMMGLNDLLLQQYKSFPDFHHSRCFLFDYNTATVYNIKIPFVCSLTDRNSKRTRDLHLLKELKNINETPDKYDKFVHIILSIQTAKVRKETLEMITEINDIELIKKSANEMKTQLISLYINNELDCDNQLVAQMCCRILQLCHLYETIMSIKIDKINVIDESSHVPETLELANEINWKESDISRCLSLQAYKDTIITREKCISNCKSITIVEFLSHFHLYSNQIFRQKNGDKINFENIAIEVKTFDNGNQSVNLKDLSVFIFSNFLLSNHINTESILSQCFIVPSNLLLLIFISWLNTNCCDYWKCWKYFNDTLKVIVKMFQSELNIEDENYLLSPSWKDINDIIYDSPNIMASLIAVHVMKAVNSHRLKENDTEKLNEIHDDSEWETLYVDNEKLNLLIKQLEDLFLLELLLRTGKCNNEPISLQKIIRSGSGIISEMVAKWSIHMNIELEILSPLNDDTDECQEMAENHDITAIGEDALREKLDSNTVKELLDHVRRCFPNCLEPDVLLANCSWESIVKWEKDPSIVANDLLKKSLSYLNCITSAVLKHNVACLIWKRFFSKRFETLAQLMEKMGKVPKERICKKELEMGENCIESFLDFSCELLEFILRTNMMAEIEPMPLFSNDDWWKHHNYIYTPNSRAPLVMLAIHQKVANAALVLEHSRIATVMLFIATFQLKGSKPLSLFSPIIRPYLFKELISFPVHASNSDPTLSNSRIKHLYDVVSSIAHSLPPFDKDNNSEESILCQSKLHSHANKWFGKVITLAREWQLTTDDLRRHFVCRLYINGCDNLAEDILISVVNLVILGNELLSIAGIRVVHYINEKYGTLEQMYSLPPNVLFWLKSLNLDTQYYTGASLGATLTLLEHINNYVHNDQNGRICDALIDAVKYLNKLDL